jgi:hypothetical protein
MSAGNPGPRRKHREVSNAARARKMKRAGSAESPRNAKNANLQSRRASRARLKHVRAGPTYRARQTDLRRRRRPFPTALAAPSRRHARKRM